MEVTESNVMTKVASVINFIKSQTKNDLVKAKNANLITIENSDLEKICNVIQTSIQSNFVKSSSEITSIFKK